MVTGTGFAPAEVVLRWDNQSGRELGRTFGPDFSVEVRAPDDAPPDPYRVFAIVTDGGSVSTLSTSFQVTGAEPVGTTTTTSVTVPEVPADPAEPATTTTVPAAAPAPAAPSGGTGISRTDSVGGGVDGGMASTTNGGEAGADTVGGRTGAGAGSAPGAGAGGSGAPTTTVAGAGGAAAAGGQPGAVTPPPPGAGEAGGPGGRAGAPTPAAGQDAGDATGSALAKRPTSQSSGAVRNPALLVVGLGMVFAAGVILAVRNRHRSEPPAVGPGG